MANDYHDALWLHAQRQVTLIELSEFSGFPQEVLLELVEYGALSPLDSTASEWMFAADCVAGMRAAARIRNALELETPEVALALSFLEQINRLQAELRSLKAQLAVGHR